MKKIIVTPNGIQELELTAEEVAQRQLDEQNAIVEKQAREAKEEAHKQAKASALAKLSALGLTQEEILSILK